jgi:hypothetical protein
MSKRTIFYGLIYLVVLLMLPWCVAGQPSQRPEVFLPENVFEFQAVPDGIPVTHQFILHNRGDAPLTILEIKSG